MNKYIVKLEDLTGSIKDYPLEIVQFMVDEQVRQGNKPDPKVFQINIASDKMRGGFDWEATNEFYNLSDNTIWDIIIRKLVDLIPKKSEYPKIMWVSGSSDFYNKFKRVVFMEKNGKYLAWSNAATFEEAELSTSTSAWNYAKNIEEDNYELSLQEIANEFGIPVDKIRIKE